MHIHRQRSIRFVERTHEFHLSVCACVLVYEKKDSQRRIMVEERFIVYSTFVYTYVYAAQCAVFSFVCFAHTTA